MLRNLIIPLALIAGSASGGEIEEVATELQGAAEKYPGSEFRASVNQATAYSQQGKPAVAWNTLQPALLYCDEKQSAGSEQVYSVADASEEAEYRIAASPGTKLVFVDWACPMAYKSAAFLAVQSKETERALALLDRAQALAPHWAEPLAERAYLIGHLGDRPAALALYRKALLLAEKYRSSAHAKALILRGIGFSLTEMGDLDGASQAYRDSLLVEPGSKLAKDELDYIEGLREEAKRKP